VAAQEWIISAFTFAFGCCIGSFLNVVIYRLPREKSLVSPGSACPGCGKPIRFYDNIPLISWLVLRARCRHCGVGISPRYFIVELLTGMVFLGLYLVYFHSTLRMGMQAPNGWFVYLVHVVLLAALIAGSGIDLELWIIPLSICWFATAVGFVGSGVGGYLIDPETIRTYSLLPVASPTTGALALGAGVGLAVGLLLLKTGLLKHSYEVPESDETPEPAEQKPKVEKGAFPFADDPEFNHRLEAVREIAFLMPIVVGAGVANAALTRPGAIATWWAGLLEVPAVAGFLGSLFGYFVGCAVVWATRVLGTLAFGKEAMGLGDVHLMGAAGSVIGPVMAVIAFFVAPFFGLGWAVFQVISKKIRQIPYGPFLSFAVFTVMILHDRIVKEFALLFSH
jgi:leader peptidase (prepilin peptidase)/N-methyltransferase